MILIAPLLLLASAQAEPEMPQAQARRTAREVLEQLIAADEHAFQLRTHEGHDRVYLRSGPRASRVGGVCEYDMLAVERAPPDRLPTPGSAPIREVKSEGHYHVIADAHGQPLWELRYEALEAQCAAIDTAYTGWFTADDVDAAKSAVAGLVALKAELMKPNSTRVEMHCIPDCPKAAELAERIYPLKPSGAWRFDRGDCPKDRWCVDVLLSNVGCGSWSTQLRMDSTQIDRFRSARIGRFVGALACGEMEAELDARAAAAGAEE